MERLSRDELAGSDYVQQGEPSEDWAPLGLLIEEGRMATPASAPDEVAEAERRARRRARIAGLGLLALLALPFIAGPVAVVILGSREEATVEACGREMARMGQALGTYAADHDGRLPYARTWERDLAAYLRRPPPAFTCPAAAPGEPSYALNPPLSGTLLHEWERPELTVLAADATKMLASPDTDEPALPRHGDGENVLFVDGHVRFMPRAVPEP